MLFHKEGFRPKVDLVIEGTVIDTVTSFKFLGLTLDTCLCFDEHFRIINNRLTSFSYIANKLSSYLPTVCLQHLYFAYFQSHLNYCFLIWYPLVKRTKQLSLTVLQKRVIRCIGRINSRTHCMPYFKKEGIVKVDDVLFIENCKFMYKLHNKLLPLPVRNLFEQKQSHYATRGPSVNVTSHSHMQMNKSFLCKPVIQ